MPTQQYPYNQNVPTPPGWENWYQPSPTGLETWAQNPLQLETYWALNQMLPQMGRYDVSQLAGRLYGAAGGAEGPFAGYTGAPAASYQRGEPIAPRADEFATLQQARGIIQGSGMGPGLRDWAVSLIDMAMDLTNQATTGYANFPRTRMQQAQLQSQLELALANPPISEEDPNRMIAQDLADWLSRLILPTRARPMPGMLQMTPYQRQGYGILPNPQWY